MKVAQNRNISLSNFVGMMMKIGRKWLFVFAGLVALPLLFALNSSDENQVVASDANWAAQQLSQLTLEQKIGQFFMIAAYSGKGDAHIQEIENSIKKNHVGGIIWFQGTKADYLPSAKRLQAASKVPLLYGMDAEWGASMRLEGEERYPYAYTLGAADDEALTGRIATMMAQECRELGIHINFGPVADVHSNPNNPVIGFRSFGENPEKVGNHVKAMVLGFEKNGIMSSIKHFPGHGDTDLDSHLDLPSVNRSFEEIDAIDLLPFREGIRNGASSVMVGHLNVPALDPSGTPTSLSKVVIKDLLQGKMGFKGLVISDALNMKAVADRYGKTDVVVKAFEAGCDILLCPESVSDAIAAIKAKVDKGEITLEEINARCLKILKAKEKFIINVGDYKKYTKGEQDWARNETFEKSTALLVNKNNALPLTKMDGGLLHISIGEKSKTFQGTLLEFGPFEEVYLSESDLKNGKFPAQLEKYKTIVVSVHATTVRPKNNFGIPLNIQNLLNKLPLASNTSFILFGNPLALNSNFDFTNVDAIVVGYENNQFVQNRIAQQIVGAIPFKGKLPITVNETFKRKGGIETKSNGRLKFGQPEELGINPADLAAIDVIVKDAIAQGAFPGCQIVAAVHGVVFFRKSYGTHMYDKHQVTDNDLYDIASITKIAGSTISVMKLQSEGKFSLDKQLKDYIPEVTKETGYGNLVLRDMLAHRAGLKAWIPFYTKTLTGGNLDPAIYSKTSKAGFTTKVEDGIFMRDDYVDSMYAQILGTSIGSKKYLYSDVGYYFVKKIIEKESQLPMANYVQKELYGPMGLTRITYNPAEKFKLDEIVPTEDDKIFRKKLIHGYVHDQGSAMLGGVGGHAGIFSTATDLAALFQLFMNNGTYGGVEYIKPEVVKEFTKVQFAGNRRGAGFDKPKTDGTGGTCTSLAALSSYGHSGFTGTLAWADPVNEVNFVFLSNRVYPDAENWKIVKMNTRTDIQRVIYEAVNKLKVKN